MRVIAGKARSLRLQTLPGMDVRPTTDRTKETLFNILGTKVINCSFLDLFGGSGAIGIEALSRGGRHAVFVERDRGAADCIRDNLIHTGLSDDAEILQTDCLSALTRLEQQKRKFDIIFMDPPYRTDAEKEMLLRLSRLSLLEEDGIIITEASLDTTFHYIEETSFELYRQKKYKTNQHVFFRWNNMGL